jgi:hypothetical protein
MPQTALAQLCLRPFDVGVALRLLLVPEERYEPMSQAMATSTSAVHRAVMRLRQAGLCRDGQRTIEQNAFVEFVTYGVPHAFPAMKAGNAAGLPTASAHPALTTLQADRTLLVWEARGYQSTGVAVVPLFPGVPQVARQDARMYRLLAAVDAIRLVHRDDRKPACALFEQWISTRDWH